MKVFVTLAVLWVMSVWTTTAQGQDVSKYQALFMYNFTKYIQWPDQGNTIIIGVLGDADVYRELLKSIHAKGNKQIQVHQLETAQEASQCDLVFLSQELSGTFDNILTETHNQSVLIVTEEASLAEAGAGISFYTESNRLRFRINKKAVSDRNIKISSQLLALGSVI